jgi:hypothetical protein
MMDEYEHEKQYNTKALDDLISTIKLTDTITSLRLYWHEDQAVEHLIDELMPSLTSAISSIIEMATNNYVSHSNGIITPFPLHELTFDTLQYQLFTTSIDIPGTYTPDGAGTFQCHQIPFLLYHLLGYRSFGKGLPAPPPSKPLPSLRCAKCTSV